MSECPELVQGEPYQGLVSECQAIITETDFASRVEIIRGKWLLGQAVCQHIEYVGAEKGGRGIESFATRLSRDLSASGQRVSPREVRRCSQFFQRYPSLALAPEQDTTETLARLDLIEIPGGKNLSWKLISRELLPAQTEVKKPSKAEVVFAYSLGAVDRVWTMADHQWLSTKMGVKHGSKAAASS